MVGLLNSTLQLIGSMAEEELKQLRQKLEAQENEFQNYRDECKMLENFLEEESSKKQMEIRQLKQEMITRQKTTKMLKTQNSQLQSQIVALKADLQARAQTADTQINHKISDLQAQIAQKSIQNQQLKQTIQNIKIQSSEQLQKETKARELKVEWEDRLRQLEDTIARLEGELQSKDSQIENLLSKNSQLSQKLAKFRSQLTESPKKAKKPENTARQVEIEKQKIKDDQKCKKYEAKIERLQRIIRELKLRCSQAKMTYSPQKTKQQTENVANQAKIFTACLIITKPYYLSPFLEVNLETRTVKLLKSSRLGCFQKSLGASKHKFDLLSYDQEAVVNNIKAKIQEFQEDYPHFVLIFGAKKTSKRALMASLLFKLLHALNTKVQQQADTDLSAIYLTKYAEEQNAGCFKQQAFTSQSIMALLEKLSKPPTNPSKKFQKGLASKRMEEPVITYFCLRVNQFCLEIATTSFTNIPIREKDLISTFYNNVLFSKLPDVLQSSYGQKYIILTLNPIVELYEDSKNILSITQHRMLYLDNKNEETKELESPNKEMLNALARKKLELYEKQIEQNSLKIRKVEDECFYYKLKFDQLEERLKNLISTHHAQNSYLKKSPILLSYEKMLKFVHSVQSKSNQTLETGGSGVQFNELEFEDDLSMEAL